MRNKIDFGIDLGTTNSAIARMENGIPVIKKSEFGKDTIASCVHYNRRQDIHVGESAFHIMKNDNTRALKTFEKGATNTFIEFKRTMGTTHSYECANMNKNFSSEELSSEILKKLKSFFQDEKISSIVVTVPAKFLNPQNEATMRAAKLAGFKQIELLQEPVAAATAYGLNSKNKDGYWLVFDFGGGTFDAALVKTDEGILSVKDTHGDNWLGGKNIDEAIVDQIFIPYLQSNYEISSILEDTVKRQILREAVKFTAEEAKIQLSFQETYHVGTNLGDLPFEDENGVEPEIDVVINQDDMDTVTAPFFQKAIDISKELLKRNNLKGSDLGALILVGGPTYSPILRRMLKEQITNEVDTSVDPMTVVAKGAALFASTISVTDEVKDETRDNTKLQLDLKFESTTVDLDTMLNIKILKDKTIGKIPDKIYVVLNRMDGAWSSGKKLISSEKVNLIDDIQLEEGKSNSFEIIIYNDLGNKIECQPNQFSILQGIGGLDGMQVLPYHIGIGTYFQTEGKDLFHQVKGLEKSKKVPAVGVTNGLKTRNAIRPGMAKDLIRVPIYQGDYSAEATNLLLNNWIFDVIISGETMPSLLPEGSDVDITIKVDRSQIMKFTAYFPLLNHTEELEIIIKQTEPPTEEALSKEISTAIKTAQRLNCEDIKQNLVKLTEQLENEKGSADGKMKIFDGLRKELLKLESAEKTAKWPLVEASLKKAFFSFEDLMSKIRENNDEGDINIAMLDAHLLEFKSRIEQIIIEKNIQQAIELTEEIEELDREIRNELSDGALDVRRVQYHEREFENLKWKDKTKARQLVNQGLKLIAEGHNNQLRPVLIQIWNLRIDPEDELSKETLVRKP